MPSMGLFHQFDLKPRQRDPRYDVRGGRIVKDRSRANHKRKDWLERKKKKRKMQKESRRRNR